MHTVIKQKHRKMKTLTFAIFALFATPLFAKKEVGAENFVVQGKIFEIDIMSEADKEANNVQVVIYQDREIYAAFNSSETGAYEFIVPVGHEYELWFGGTTYVNKKIYVDARSVPSRKSGYECNIDVGLFKPVENVEFPTLAEHWVKVRWDAEYRQLVPDYEYTDDRAMELNKQLKKARKAQKGS